MEKGASEDAEYERLESGDVVVAVSFLGVGFSGGLGIDGKVSMSQKEISSKEKAERVVVAVGVAEEGRVTDSDKRLGCPPLKTAGSGFGTGPLPPFLIFFFRKPFALAVLSERGKVVSDCVD